MWFRLAVLTAAIKGDRSGGDAGNGEEGGDVGERAARRCRRGGAGGDGSRRGAAVAVFVALIVGKGVMVAVGAPTCASDDAPDGRVTRTPMITSNTRITAPTMPQLRRLSPPPVLGGRGGGGGGDIG